MCQTCERCIHDVCKRVCAKECVQKMCAKSVQVDVNKSLLLLLLQAVGVLWWVWMQQGA